MIKEQYFNGILEDSTFKFLLHIDDILKDIVNSYLRFIGINKYVVFAKITTQSHIMPDRFNLKDFYGDIIATLNTGEMIIIEAYTSFGKKEYNKSLSYMCRLYSNQIKKGKNNYQNNQKVTCLCFMNGNYRRSNNELVNTYMMQNTLTNKVLDTGDLEMVLIRVDLSEGLNYNKDTDRFIRWLKFMDADSLDELKNISEGDEIMEQTLEYVQWYLSSENNRSLEDKLAEKREEGELAGKKAGIIETAKNMLAKGISLEDIHEITGLPLKEIEKLKSKL